MQRLAVWLRGEIARTSVREVAARTGLGTGTISRIANNQLKERPELTTLVKLAEGLHRPLADVVEMTGEGLGLPGEDDDLLARLQAEAASDEQLAEILRLLRQAPEQDRRAVLVYLRGALSSGQ